MTTKERICTALMGQMPDRIPFTIYRGIVSAEEGLDDLIARGMGFMTSCHVHNVQHPNVEISQEDEVLDGIPTKVVKYKTPVGEIRQRSRTEPGYGSSWTVEHFIKVISINFPSSVHIAEPETIRDVALQLLREAAPGNGFVIGVTENVPKSVGTRSLSAIIETIDKYGACPISI